MKSKILLITCSFFLFFFWGPTCQGQDCWEFWRDYGTSSEKCLFRGSKSDCNQAKSKEIAELKKTAYGNGPDFMGLKKGLGDLFLENEIPRYSVRPCKNVSNQPDKTETENIEHATNDADTKVEKDDSSVELAAQEAGQNAFNNAVENNRIVRRLDSDSQFTNNNSKFEGDQPQTKEPQSIDKVLQKNESGNKSVQISDKEYNQLAQEFVNSGRLGREFKSYAEEKYSAYKKEQHVEGSDSDYESFYKKLKEITNQEVRKKLIE